MHCFAWLRSRDDCDTPYNMFNVCVESQMLLTELVVIGMVSFLTQAGADCMSSKIAATVLLKSSLRDACFAVGFGAVVMPGNMGCCARERKIIVFSHQHARKCDNKV